MKRSSLKQPIFYPEDSGNFQYKIMWVFKSIPTTVEINVDWFRIEKKSYLSSIKLKMKFQYKNSVKAVYCTRSLTDYSQSTANRLLVCVITFDESFNLARAARTQPPTQKFSCWRTSTRSCHTGQPILKCNG